MVNVIGPEIFVVYPYNHDKYKLNQGLWLCRTPRDSWIWMNGDFNVGDRYDKT